MHLTVADHNMLGSYAIVGAHLPIACGAAWSATARHQPGRGGLLRRRGDQHRRLPRGPQPGREAGCGLFVCENNLYMEYTSIKTVTAVAAGPGRAPPTSSRPR